ncbi:MAG: VWA domain-containing protein [Thermoplasmata archaeon]|nr:VWA domain-containing protein [Thermoplasmata archaeon]
MTEVEYGTAPLQPPPRERHVLILDLSKSMLAPLPDADGQGPEKQKIEVARTAVYRILENAETSGAFFGLVTFTESVRVAVPLTEIRRENLPYVESLISMLAPSGRSAIWDALAAGADLLRSGAGGAVHGNLVLVTHGWDNASTRFEVRDPSAPPATATKMDLIPHLLPPGSMLSIRVIGIGSGSERDKGVDSTRINSMLALLGARSQEFGLTNAFTYQEVVTGSQLFSQMVNAFLDVDFEGSRALDELHPEELARNAASAARALKEPQQHATVSRLSGHMSSPAAKEELYSEAPSMEIDVLSAPNGIIPPYLKERYGPLGGVIESYLAQDYPVAMERLVKAGPSLPGITRFYWEARIHFAQGEIVEAARSLLQAWGEAEQLPPQNRGRIMRRLALLQSRMQNDKETETLVQFIDVTESHLARGDPTLHAHLQELFARLMELRGTYQLTRLEGASATNDAAQKHETAVEQIFSLLQDARLENTGADTAVDGALDFIEICLAEMR